jgi:UDP-N-acetylmuramoylalanine--D-glutamate ligase
VERIAHMLSSPEGRRVLVVGLARSGRAAALALAARGARVVGTDRQASPAGLEPLRAAGVEFDLGADRPELATGAELVVLSPGVPLSAPVPRAALAAGVPVLGELELGARLCGLPLLAVTGTNGKSTTTTLCAHLMTRAGLAPFLGGNIGRPLCDLLLLPEAERRALRWAVVEVSSYQLEHLSAPTALAPRIAVWLNLTPDHVERHGSLETYAAMKRRLLEGQDARAAAIILRDDPIVARAAEGLACRVRGFGHAPARLRSDDVHIVQGRRLELGALGLHLTLGNPRLAGAHNAENAAAAVLAVLEAGADPACLQAGLDDFPGLPHRIEPVRELQGVRWVNDSKGTNVDATLKSLGAFDVPIVLIAGGLGKGTGYQALREPVRARVRHLILLGKDAPRLEADLQGCAPTHRVADLRAAVALARRLAEPGQVVLLSPACASFDQFRDFEQRGEIFAELVRALPEGA